MTAKESPHTLIVGTRGSLLARTQTQWVCDALTAAHPDLEVRTEIIRTRGDAMQKEALPDIGGKGLFTEELERALLENRIDIAVHSVKDLPTDVMPGSAVLAYPKREDPRDAWISTDGTPFEAVQPGSVVGTSSLRRQSQLLMRRPDITFIALRGNVDTRISKIHRGDCTGAVLAMAGLIRAGLTQHVTHPFEPDEMLSAPGQGALGLQGREDDKRVIDLLAAIHDEETCVAVNCERGVLHALDAGCRAPVAVYASCENDRLACRAIVSDPKGATVLRAEASGTSDAWAGVCDDVVAQLRDAGADDIIAACRRDD